MSAATLAASVLRPRIAQQRLRYATFAVVAAGLAAAYYVLGASLERAGYVSPVLTFFGEKGALALHGLPPRFVNVGFVYPSLSYLLQLPFASPLAGQAVIAALATTTAIDAFRRRIADPATRRLACAYVVVSPVFLYLAVEDASTLLFALLIAASIRNITRFLRADYSLDLFTGSTFLGLAFFIDFRSAALLIAIVPAAALPLWRRSRTQALSVALTIAVPTVFFALAWSYINWVFLGDPFAYVHGRGSLFRTFPITPDLLAAAGDPLLTLRFTVAALVASLPVTLPYVIAFVRRCASPTADALPSAIVFASPLAFVAFAIFGGIYRPTIGLLALVVLVLCFSLEAIKPSRMLAVTLAVSFVASFAAPFVSPDAAERGFAAALIGRGTSTGALAPFRDIAAHLGDRGAILIDDGALYPLVYVLGSPQRFILPYQYEYASVLSNPAPYVRYIVVARRADDTIYALYPGAEFGHFPAFHEIDRLPGYIVFQRDARP